MLIVSIIISVGLLGVIIYLVVSPKSSRLLRLSGIIALGLIGLSLGICGIFLVRGGGSSHATAIVPLPFLPEDAPPPKNTNLPVVISFFLVFLFILGLIVVTTIRDKNKKPTLVNRTEKKAALTEAVHENTELDISPLQVEEDSFDIGIE